MESIKKILPRAIGFVLLLTIICGGLYGLIVTGIGQLAFPNSANGSIIEIEGKQYGSELLAQNFSAENHLWGRIMQVDTETFKDESGHPLMTAVPSNLSTSSQTYNELIKIRVENIKKSHPGQENMPVPVDLVTVSGSGLDPHISPVAAEYQVNRLVNHTSYSESEIRAIIKRYTEEPFLGFIGEVRVNVLKVNLALDGVLK